MVTKQTLDLARKDGAHFYRQLSVVGKAPTIIWERGKGTKLWDTNGKQYIDMSSGHVHFSNLGYARKELNDAAYEQMQKISHMHTAGFMSNIQAIEYAAELAEVLPGDINHVCFTNTGTESTEVAVQVARFYWEAQGQANKYKLLCLSDNYHGCSALSRSLSSFRYLGMAGFGHVYPNIIRVPNYHCYRCSLGLNYPDCGIACARFLGKVIETEGEETVVALIAEAVLGPAGVIWPPNEYWPIVRRICSENNILLIADEVQTGFCRTGKFWGVDNWNIVPDIMTMGKGINSGYLPLGAVGVSDKVHKVFSGECFMAGATSDANPTVIATGRAALKIYKEEKLAERAAKLGEHIHERLVNEFLTLPCIDNIMGKGLYQSFEIALNKTTSSEFNYEAVKNARDSMRKQCLEKGVLTSGDGYPWRMPIVPPYIIDEDELDAGLDIILDVMKEVEPV